MENGFTAYDGYYRMTNVMVLALIIINRDKFAILEIGKKTNATGIGVSYTPHGENIHVGRWSEDKPVGTGAIFDGDGNLSFAGKIENGMRQGVGISYKVEDGTIFVGKWK